MTVRRLPTLAVAVLLLIVPTITPAQTIASVALSQNSVRGGKNASGTVTLNTPAPAGGITVLLSSTNPAVAHPTLASITIGTGETTKTFAITTAGVWQNTLVTIAALAGATSRSTVLNVQAVVSAITLGRSSVLGGFGTAVAVLLFSPVPDNVYVSLSGSNPAVAIVPAGIAFLPGQTSASETIVAVPVVQNTVVTITATYEGLVKTLQLTVEAPVLEHFTVGPSTTGPKGEVELNGKAPSGGITVSLTSADPAVAAVPARVTIPAGATKLQFPIATPKVAKAATVKLTASAGAATFSREVTVSP